MVTGVKTNSDDYKDDKTLFSMTGEITGGLVRINDQADIGLSTEAKANLDKIYAFMNKTSMSDESNSTSVGEENNRDTFESCFAKKSTTCKLTKEGLTYKRIEITNNICVDDHGEGLSSADLCTNETFYILQDPVSYEIYGTGPDDSTADYWTDAKNYCNQHGGELATLAQLHAGGYNAGTFWSSTDSTNGRAYVLWDNEVDDNNKNYNDVKAVCVGNAKNH